MIQNPIVSEYWLGRLTLHSQTERAVIKYDAQMGVSGGERDRPLNSKKRKG
jgi:hypothetical protein